MRTMKFLLRVVINAVAIWLATLLLGESMEMVGGDSDGERVLVFLVVALVFGIVNAIVKPIVKVLSLPLYILTLGLFTIVVNAAMLWLVAWLSERTDYGLRIDDFWTAIVGGLIISVVSFVLSLVIRD